jgi:hypothetical protein
MCSTPRLAIVPHVTGPDFIINSEEWAYMMAGWHYN